MLQSIRIDMYKLYKMIYIDRAFITVLRHNSHTIVTPFNNVCNVTNHTTVQVLLPKLTFYIAVASTVHSFSVK